MVTWLLPRWGYTILPPPRSQSQVGLYKEWIQRFRCQMPGYKSRVDMRKNRHKAYIAGVKNRRKEAVQASRIASYVASVSRAYARGSLNRKFVTGAKEDIQMYHNNGGAGPVACIDPVANSRPSNLLGTAANLYQANRIGDNLRGVGVAVKLWLSNKLDRPNVMYRIIVLQFYHGFDPNAATSIWRANASPNIMLAGVDTDRFKVRYDRVINPTIGYSAASLGTELASSANMKGKEFSKLHKFYIKTPGIVRYQTDNGQIPADEKYCLALYVLAYDAKGSLTGDVIASCAYETTFYFRDAWPEMVPGLASPAASEGEAWGSGVGC